MDEICVLGLGYIGLPTALMLASCGKQVVGVDIDSDLVDSLNRGELTFQEDGLEELLHKAHNSGIRFETTYPSAKIYVVAVPTPFDKVTKKINSSYVVQAVKSIVDVCPPDSIVIIESTVSPGTIEKFIRPIIQKSEQNSVQKSNIHLVHAPERITPGKMLRELRENARVVGADSLSVGEQVRDIYASFCKGEIVLTDIAAAEMTKVVENTYRDINIAFANELAKICRQDGLNVYEIINIANMHPRVDILQPGPGVGGHCISVDPWFLVGDYPDLSLLIHEARKINDSMPSFVLRRVHDILNRHNKEVSQTKVGFYGITYKEDVDDVRESPTLQLYDLMRLHLGVGAIFYDPLCQNVLPGQISDFDEFINACELIVIMVGHKHIKENFQNLKDKLILDTRNVCNLLECYKL